MNVLVACEESQEVCKAFREKGHNAFSCDLQDCSGGHPEWHIKGDVTSLLNGFCGFYDCAGGYHLIASPWDMIIAFPPCTYLTKAGACNIKKDPSRIYRGIEAKNFFMAFYNADCDKICIENPVPMKRFNLPPYSCIINPYDFGHPFSKMTCLWLKNLPVLFATSIFNEYQTCSQSSWFNNYSRKNRSLRRSKTFPGVAKAMAEQWG